MGIELGPDWQTGLWASPFRLRFELNQGGPYVSMFTKSYDRARSLARAALPGDDIIAIIAAYPDPRKELGAKHRGWTKGTAFGLLEHMGTPTKPTLASWKGPCWPQGEGADEIEPWDHRAVRVTWDQADILLWNQVAHDLGVTPQAPVLAQLVDIERGVAVNAYDDRGMEITALAKDPIADLYTRFASWLLDYDRPGMREAFRD